MSASVITSRRSVLKSFLPALALGIGLFLFTGSASAQTPVATGSMRYANGAPWASFQAFPTTSNAFGYYLRIQMAGGRVMTAAPSGTLPDGRIECWFIEYNLIGATKPDGTQGWQWVQTGGGRAYLSSTPTGLDGIMAYTWTGTQNMPAQQIANPQYFGIKITTP
jgi:hypothetical protein